MDPELQKKLEEYGAGFENVLQHRFLEDEYTKFVKGERMDLMNKGDDLDEIIRNGGCAIRRYSPYEELMEMVREGIPPFNKAAALKKKGARA